MADFLDLIQQPGSQVSGPALTGKKGWGKAPFCGNKSHYFELIGADAIGSFGRELYWVAACGTEAVTHGKAPMFSAGSWKRCKNCERRVKHG